LAICFSSLGIPYHSWRISHAKHHASTNHLTQDQVYVPETRSQAGLKPFDPAREDRLGSRVSEDVKKEMWEALGDSPIVNALKVTVKYLVRDVDESRRIRGTDGSFLFISYLDSRCISCLTLLVKRDIPKIQIVRGK
jgi:hypothetical protein